MNQVFFYHRHNIMQILEINQIAGLWSVTASSTSGLPWWVSPLLGSDWMALRKFILEERNYYSSVWAMTDNH